MNISVCIRCNKNRVFGGNEICRPCTTDSNTNNENQFNCSAKENNIPCKSTYGLICISDKGMPNKYWCCSHYNLYSSKTPAQKMVEDSVKLTMMAAQDLGMSCREYIIYQLKTTPEVYGKYNFMLKNLLGVKDGVESVQVFLQGRDEGIL